MDIGKNGKIDVTKPQLPVAYQLELHRIIEVDAYLRAEANGFRRSPLDYW
jgi:hypothetical protein